MESFGRAMKWKKVIIQHQFRTFHWIVVICHKSVHRITGIFWCKPHLDRFTFTSWSLTKWYSIIQISLNVFQCVCFFYNKVESYTHYILSSSEITTIIFDSVGYILACVYFWTTRKHTSKFQKRPWSYSFLLYKSQFIVMVPFICVLVCLILKNSG